MESVDALSVPESILLSGQSVGLPKDVVFLCLGVQLLFMICMVLQQFVKLHIQIDT